MDKDILVVKADFNDYEEIAKLDDYFRGKYGDTAEILILRCDEEDSDVYWASTRNKIIITFEKLNDDANIPQQASKNSAWIPLSCTCFEYNRISDEYIYHTGLKIKDIHGGYHAIIEIGESANDCYISGYTGLNDNGDGEITIKFKNRTPMLVRELMSEFKRNALDFAPFRKKGDIVAKIRFVNAPYVKIR